MMELLFRSIAPGRCYYVSRWMTLLRRVRRFNMPTGYIMLRSLPAQLMSPKAATLQCLR